MKKKILSLLLALLFIIPINVHAASLGISASSTTVTTGSSVRVTVKANGLAGRFSITSSNSNVLSGGENSKWLENDSETYTFKANNVGTATVTIKAVNAADSSSSATFTGSKSITIKVVKPREKSNNNNLKGLGIEGYSITPEFNKDTLEYSSEIPSSVEKINIQADKEDGYATVDGAGEQEVKEGLNKFEIKVTSETGKEKVYVLNVNLVDKEPIEKTLDGKKYTVIKRASSLTLPDGVDKEAFTTSTIKMNEVDIPVYTSESLNLTLIGLKDEKGNIYLYKYENENITDRYETLTSKAMSILIENPKEELEGYTKTTVTINNKEYTAYQNEYKDYVLIYGTNLETNESNWYSYNIKENTLQLYNKDMIDDMNNSFKTELDQYKLVILGLGGLAIVLLLIIVILASKRSKKKVVNKTQEKLEDTKEIDTTEIIINKVEEKEEKNEIKKESKKKEKKNHNKKESEFLNEDDIKEILDNKKEDDMDMEFFDDYKGKKKKKK